MVVFLTSETEFYFSSAGKFCLAHGLRQLTREASTTSLVYKRSVRAVTKTPNDVRSWPSYHIIVNILLKC